jgi:hypothetical protein
VSLPRSLWSIFLTGRDPNPPVKVVVFLEGCTPFDGSFDPKKQVCPTCKGRIRESDEGFYCVRCDAMDPLSDAILGLARGRTDAATREERRAERATQAKAKAKTIDAWLRRWKRIKVEQARRRAAG